MALGLEWCPGLGAEAIRTVLPPDASERGVIVDAVQRHTAAVTLAIGAVAHGHVLGRAEGANHAHPLEGAAGPRYVTRNWPVQLDAATGVAKD
jgi:hypothetical protein